MGVWVLNEWVFWLCAVWMRVGMRQVGGCRFLSVSACVCA